jgi:hypothetical protein
VHAQTGSSSQLLLSPGSATSDGARLALAMAAPASLVLPERPPGFERSPVPRTPPLLVDGSPARTPELVKKVACTPLALLFTAAQAPILSPATSSPPLPAPQGAR